MLRQNDEVKVRRRNRTASWELRTPVCYRYTMRTGGAPPGLEPGMPDAESNVITDFTTEAERLLGIEPSLPRTQHGVLPLTLQPRTLEL